MSTDPIARVIGSIGELDAAAMDAARVRQRALTKPEGSLGRLEELAINIAGITGSPTPRLARKAVIVVAADHGVAAAGVSAFPQAVTTEMVRNFLRGGAAINALAQGAGARVVVVDAGVTGAVGAHPRLYSKRIGIGTRDLRRCAAMSRTEASATIAAGIDVLEQEAQRGLDVVATGDMGIANTTSASAIVATFCDAPVAAVTGRGTGIDAATHARKVAVIGDALELHRPDPADPIGVLAKVGGFEIGALAGVILAAAGRRIPVVLDGFITGAAALVAVALAPAVRPFLIAAHRSPEPGHAIALDRLGLVPLLDLGMRLGEGSGAAVALLVIDAALRAHSEMATFAEADVSERCSR